jgi:hypothetical protein
MERVAFRPARKLVVGSIALTLAGVTAFAPSAFSAERVVLGEYFTWTGCIYCPAAGQQINGMVNTYGVYGNHPTLAGTLAVVEYNLWDSYQLPWGANRGQSFYNAIFLGTPCFVLDGLWDAYPTPTYVSKFLTRQAVDSPVTIGIAAEETSPNRYDTTVEVCLEAGAAPVTLRIYTIFAEDKYPPAHAYDRNGFRAAAPTVDVNLAPGECETVVPGQVTVIPRTPHKKNLRVIAWAQEPNSHWPADVYQAAIDAHPFEPATPPCPWDCGNEDGNVGVNDFLVMIAGWGGPGSCDFDGGGVINVADFLELLANWGPCPE